MSADRRVLRSAHTDQLAPETLAELTRLCEAAFEESFEHAWDAVGPGVHVIAEVDRRIVAHAMIVDRRLYVGGEMDVAIDTGYVEHVATLPSEQRHGHASAVMREVNRILGEEYALGALATGSSAFYERLGWDTWRGPTSVRMPDGERVRSASDDGGVMVLRTPRTPRLSGEEPIAVDWRAGEPW